MNITFEINMFKPTVKELLAELLICPQNKVELFKHKSEKKKIVRKMWDQPVRLLISFLYAAKTLEFFL